MSCPACGFCPACGRGGYGVYPRYWPYQPWIHWQGQSTALGIQFNQAMQQSQASKHWGPLYQGAPQPTEVPGSGLAGIATPVYSEFVTGLSEAKPKGK